MNSKYTQPNYFFNEVVFSKLNISLTVYLYVLLAFTPPSFSHIFLLQSLWMASLHAMECSIPFHLPLGPSGVVVIQESLLRLKFGLQLDTMYVEQKLLHGTRVLWETIFVQNSRKDVGSFWTLGGGSFKVIGLFEMQMDLSTMLLTNEFITTTLQSNGMRRVKLIQVRKKSCSLAI